MPSLKDLRVRIASVQSTKKITRAMQMVSAAKLKKVQERLMTLRPYADKITAADRELEQRPGLVRSSADRPRVAYHDSCHMLRELRLHDPPRRLLAAVADLHELPRRQVP